MASVFKRGSQKNGKRPFDARWQGCFTDRNGIRRMKSTGTTLHDVALRIVHKWEADEALRREGVIDGRLETIATREAESIYKHLDLYERSLSVADRTVSHIRSACNRVQVICEAARFKCASDITAIGVEKVLSELKSKGSLSIKRALPKSLTIDSALLMDIVEFVRWLRENDLQSNVIRPIGVLLADFSRDMPIPDERIQKIIRFCHLAKLRSAYHLEGATINEVAEKLRAHLAARNVKEDAKADARAAGLNNGSIGAYLRAMRAFVTWLVRNERLRRNPLTVIKCPNSDTDRRYVRRMLLPDEWTWLRKALLFGPRIDRPRIGRRSRFDSAQRYLLYATALSTGLRASELRALMPAKLVLDNDEPHIILEAVIAKNRRSAKQNLRPDLAAELSEHIAKRSYDRPVFDMPRGRAAEMVRNDLANARKLWEQAGNSEPTDFLLPVNQAGEVFDFHGFRHSCGSWLIMAGVNIKVVQTIMRHASIDMTVNNYGHIMPGAGVQAVNRFPSFNGEPSEPAPVAEPLPEPLAAIALPEFSEPHISEPHINEPRLREPKSRRVKDAEPLLLRKKIVGSTPLQKRQELLAEHVKLVCRGFSFGVFVVGSGGLGKSRTIAATLGAENVTPALVNSHVSPLALYRLLYIFRDEKIIWLDDCDGAFQDILILGLLRSALWGDKGRIVTYNSTKLPEGLPPSFEFKSRIICSANQVPRRAAAFRAVISRIDYFELEASNDDVLQMMATLADQGCRELSVTQCREVLDVINRFADERILTMRTWENSLQKYEYALQTGADWRAMVECQLERF